MQILFITSRLPFPPDRGDRLRTYNFLKQFSREHAVTLVSFTSDEDERVRARELSEYCAEIHLVSLPEWRSRIGVAINAWRTTPLQVLYYQSGAMQRTIDNIIGTRKIDAAYVHLFRMAPYLNRHQQIYRILDLTDLISLELAASLPYRSPAWRMLYKFEQPRIARYERLAAEWYDEVWFISERDRTLFSDRIAKPLAQVIPNGIDPQLFLVEREDRDLLKVAFVGNFDVPHNIDAARFLAREIMPILLHASPDSELQLVGAGDLRSVEDLDHLPGVRVVGFVPDLAELFAQSALFIAPLRFSAGAQNKVLEAMAAALPVVTGIDVTVGIGAVAGEHVLIAETAEEYAAHALRLLRDTDLSRRIGQNARSLVRERFSWQTAVDRLRAINRQMVS